jgi:hypothetical protein
MLTSGAAFGRMMPQVIAHLEAAGATPGISVAVHEDDGGAVPEGEIPLHAGFTIGDQEVPGSETVRVVNLPAIDVAGAVYRRPVGQRHGPGALGSWPSAGYCRRDATRPALFYPPSRCPLGGVRSQRP